jgi:hypothetical protein
VALDILHTPTVLRASYLGLRSRVFDLPDTILNEFPLRLSALEWSATKD